MMNAVVADGSPTPERLNMPGTSGHVMTEMEREESARPSVDSALGSSKRSRPNPDPIFPAVPADEGVILYNIFTGPLSKARRLIEKAGRRQMSIDKIIIGQRNGVCSTRIDVDVNVTNLVSTDISPELSDKCTAEVQNMKKKIESLMIEYLAKDIEDLNMKMRALYDETIQKIQLYVPSPGAPVNGLVVATRLKTNEQFVKEITRHSENSATLVAKHREKFEAEGPVYPPGRLPRFERPDKSSRSNTPSQDRTPESRPSTPATSRTSNWSRAGTPCRTNVGTEETPAQQLPPSLISELFERLQRVELNMMGRPAGGGGSPGSYTPATAAPIQSAAIQSARNNAVWTASTATNAATLPWQTAESTPGAWTRGLQPLSTTTLSNTRTTTSATASAKVWATLGSTPSQQLQDACRATILVPTVPATTAEPSESITARNTTTNGFTTPASWLATSKPAEWRAAMGSRTTNTRRVSFAKSKPETKVFEALGAPILLSQRWKRSRKRHRSSTTCWRKITRESSSWERTFAGIVNLGVIDVCEVSKLSPDEKMVLALGVNFIPIPPDISNAEIQHDMQDYSRRIRLRKQFRHSQESSDGELFLRVPNPTFQPRPAGRLLEDYIKKAEQRLLDMLLSFPEVSHSNDARLEKCIQNLVTRRDLVFKSADKDRVVVVMDHWAYEEEALRQLNDVTSYQRVYEIPSAETIFQPLIDSAPFILVRGGAPTQLGKFILRGHPMVGGNNVAGAAKFYLRMKVHKPGPLKGRPIAASVNSITYNASKYLDRRLSEIGGTTITRAKGGTDVILDLENQIFPENSVLLAFDVDNLYPSITIDGALNALAIRLRIRCQQGSVTLEESKTLIAIARWILENNFLEFGALFWKQTRGLAMGTPVAVTLANIFLEDLELRVPGKCMQLVGQACKPLFYRRFIDDGLAIFASIHEANGFVKAYNSMCEGIHITEEISETTAVFLDFTVFKGKQFHQKGVLDIKLYQKPSNKYMYLPFSSYHARVIYKSFIIAEVERYRIRSTHEEDFNGSKKALQDRLLARGYPKEWLHEILASTRHDRDRALNNLRQKRACTSQGRKKEIPLVFKTFFTPRHPLLNLGACLKLTDELQMEPDVVQIFGNQLRPVICYKRPKNLRDRLVRATHILSREVP